MVNKIAATAYDDDDACYSKKLNFERNAPEKQQKRKNRAIFLVRNGKRRNKKSFDINVLTGV